jgi:hypothetical protein
LSRDLAGFRATVQGTDPRRMAVESRPRVPDAVQRAASRSLSLPARHGAVHR